MDYFYIKASGQAIGADDLYANTGFYPTDSTSYLSANGIYLIVPSDPPYDPALYENTPVYTVNGEVADETWVGVPLPLPAAKDNASVQAKNSSNTQAADLITASGVNVDIWTGAASQDPASRPPVYNTLLNGMATIGDNLATTLTAIDTATSVDDINNIINPPTGILNTGRGSGLGPDDLNPSYYTSFNSTTLAEADTELYVPSTTTVIPYDAVGLPPPFVFDSMGDCFNGVDYEIQIRVAATSEVIATLTVPFTLTNVDIPFTGNPVLSSGGGGGGSSHAE
jgi:hypothetical protein